MRDRPAHPPGRPARVVVVGVVGVVAFVVPIFVAHYYGALGIPRGDDWSYLETLFRFTDHGTLDGNNWVSMTLIGQLVLAAPVVGLFGHDIAAVQITVALAGVAGLLATLSLGSQSVGWSRALVLVIAVGVGPMWGPLAASYMTDVPAFAATVLALALARRAFATPQPSRPFVAAALAAGVFAFSIRQYAVVVVVTIGVTAIWASASGSDRRARAALALMFVASLVACAALYAGWSQIPHLKSYVPALPDGHSLSVTVIKGGGFLRLVGLILAPVVVLADPVAIIRRSWQTSRLAALVAGPGLGLVLAVLSVRVPGQQFVGNYVDANGALSSDALLGHRPDVFPGGVYAGLVFVGIVSGVVIALSAIPPAQRLLVRARHRDFALGDPVITCVTLTVSGYLLAYGFAMVTGVSVYDRYALPMIPLIGILLLHSTDAAGADRGGHTSRTSTTRRVGAGLAVALVAFVGLVFTIDSASFDGTRWKVAVAANERGYTKREINGGFEWVNFYRGTRRPRIVVGAKPDDRTRLRGQGEPASIPCVSVVVDPKRDDRPVILERAYASPLRADARIVALKNRCRTAVEP